MKTAMTTIAMVLNHMLAVNTLREDIIVENQDFNVDLGHLGVAHLLLTHVVTMEAHLTLGLVAVHLSHLADLVLEASAVVGLLSTHVEEALVMVLVLGAVSMALDQVVDPPTLIHPSQIHLTLVEPVMAAPQCLAGD